MHSNRTSNLPNYRHLDGLRMKILFVWVCPEVNLNEVYFIMPESTNRLQSQSEQKSWHVNKCANDGQLHYSFCPQPTRRQSTPSKISVTNRWHHCTYRTSAIEGFSWHGVAVMFTLLLTTRARYTNHKFPLPSSVCHSAKKVVPDNVFSTSAC